MNITTLKLSVLAVSISLIALSCRSQTYVTSNPPPPVYTPPPPAPVYAEQPGPQQTAPVSYQSFYDELSPYGQWISSPQYGYVWIPAAGAAFQPYGSCGHWVLTNYGWTWASDYNWGWAPFHYGTWEYDNMMGWYWIPGYQWAPAWVSWRSCNGYYGWAPLGPTYTTAGYATYRCAPERYVFVNATYMNNPNMGRYYEPRAQNATYFNRSNVVTATYYDNGSRSTYYSGPQSTEVERYTGAPIRPVTVVNSSTPERDGNNNGEFRMFRPSVQQPGNINNGGNNSSANMQRPAPSKVYQTAEVTPVQQRQVLTQPNQPRSTPYRSENSQHPANQPNEQNRQQPQVEQQKPPVQQQQQPQVEQQRPPVQQQQPQVEQQQHPVQQQQPQVEQQKPPVQQQQQPQVQQQKPPVQQQQQPQVQQQRPPVQQQQQPQVQQQRPPVQQQQPQVQQQHPVQPQVQQRQQPPAQQQHPVQQQSQKPSSKPQKPASKPQPSKQSPQQQGQQQPQGR